MPALDKNKFHYVLAGFGPYESYYQKIIREKKLLNVTIVGKIDDVTKAKLYLSSDLFIMPNICVEGDMEGYGIVLLEAQHYNLPIVASRIDGIDTRLSEHDFILESENIYQWREFFKSHFL